jgi:F1F0 ATPase subunit 2
MNDVLTPALAFAAGLLLGAAVFGGLWWTVRRGMASARPALWFLGGLIARMGVALVAFYLIGGADWRRWVACLVGFVLARFVVQRLTRDIRAPAGPTPSGQGAPHAS